LRGGPSRELARIEAVRAPRARGRVAALEVGLHQLQGFLPPRGQDSVGRLRALGGIADGHCGLHFAVRDRAPARRGSIGPPSRATVHTPCIIPASARFKTMVVHPSAADSPPGSAQGSSTEAGWQAIDWRRHQRWVRVGERAINTIELGSGEPAIVFVHGLSGCWPNWLEQLAVFSRSQRVLAFDLPGFGHSPGHAGEVSMPGYARIVADLLAARGVERAVLVGNSMGGLISAELAAEEPSLVERLVLVSPAGLSTYANRITARSMPAIRRGQQALALAAQWTASHSDGIAARRRTR